MRTSDSPFVADWFIVSLRWLVLLGLIVSLSLGGQLLILPNVILDRSGSLEYCPDPAGRVEPSFRPSS